MPRDRNMGSCFSSTIDEPARQQQYNHYQPQKPMQATAPPFVQYPPVKQTYGEDPTPVQAQQYVWQQPQPQYVYQQTIPQQYQQQQYTYAVAQQYQHNRQPPVYPQQQQQSGIGIGGALVGGLVLGAMLDNVLD